MTYGGEITDNVIFFRYWNGMPGNNVGRDCFVHNAPIFSTFYTPRVYKIHTEKYVIVIMHLLLLQSWALNNIYVCK